VLNHVQVNELPIPTHFDQERVGQVWRVPYQQRAGEAQSWAKEHHIQSASQDSQKISLLLIDVQNTFCLPDFELYVAGRSGRGAIDDNRRLAGFIYRNLHRISNITLTMDTHQAVQIFHAIYLVDEHGRHPEPLTMISVEDITTKRWRFNPAVANSLNISPDYGQEQLLYYTRQLQENEKYDLTIWPYHAMLGGIGHAVVASVEEAVFFHTIARNSQASFIVKGSNPFTESYSAIGPEVRNDSQGKPLGEKTDQVLNLLMNSKALIIAGQAKSHCVAWTIADLLSELRPISPDLAKKIYILEDCTSPVVIPDVVDFTDSADATYQKFAQAGMHLVQSNETVDSWPDLGSGERIQTG
jgi:nicotinamidase-related amidase